VRALFVQHVAWEGPHRIGERIGRRLPSVAVNVLEGGTLPDPHLLACAVLMGGPMSVGDIDRHPGLLEELRWVERALDAGLPLMGICLGSQLIAAALGARVGPAPRPELGWGRVEVHVPDDPVLGPLAPAATALHWHGDAFPTPSGAALLASSARTECQAFRAGNAWGILFHPEADADLVRAWLDEPTMAAQAGHALGPGARERLLDDAARHEAELRNRSTTGFDAFTRMAMERAEARPAARTPQTPRG
jgi:GMP synthase (glutamine-hydrolysing)